MLSGGWGGEWGEGGLGGEGMGKGTQRSITIHSAALVPG